MMHNKNTQRTEVNENTVVNVTPTAFLNTVHLRKHSTCHWSANTAGVTNVEITKHKEAEWVEFDFTETNLETGHEKRVMLSLKKDEVEALKLALNNL